MGKIATFGKLNIRFTCNKVWLKLNKKGLLLMDVNCSFNKSFSNQTIGFTFILAAALTEEVGASHFPSVLLSIFQPSSFSPH